MVQSQPPSDPPAHRPARILSLVTDAFGGHGGIAVYNRDFLRALCSSPLTAEVTVLPRLMPRESEPLPRKLTHVTAGLGGKLRYLGALVRLLAARPKIDLVVCAHIHLMPLAYVARLVTGAPIVLMIYGIDVWQPPRSALARFALRGVSAFISISEVTRGRFEAWARTGHARAYILPNAIHLDAYSPGGKDPAFLARYALAGKRVLMTFGRLAGLERSKGFDEVLECLPRLAEKLPDIAYLIAGDGPDRARLARKAAELGVSDRVVFTGFVPEAEKAPLYRLADAYIMPSRGEGFGFVILEALASGIPTVASKADGGREALRDGLLGILVDPDRPEELEQAVLLALSRPKHVPSGLDYFSYANFESRVHRILGECLAAVRSPR